MKKLLFVLMLIILLFVVGCYNENDTKGEGSKIIKRSVPQGDYVKDESLSEDVCKTIQEYNCKLIDSKRIDSPDDEDECVDGASVAGCFACTFECGDGSIVAESEEILVDCVNTSAGYECTYIVPKYDLDTLRLQVNKADDKLREQCEADGGKYKCYGFCTEDYTRFCDFPFEDAGTACTDSSECQGLCLADDWECENDCTGTCATYRLDMCDNPTHLTNGVSYFESVLCD